MGPNRNENRVMASVPARQSGITFIGLLFLLAVFGFLGLAGLKIVPLYLEKMQIEAVLGDVQREASGNAPTLASIRNQVYSRLYVESIQMPRQDVSIRQVREGFQVEVHHEMRSEFIAGLWFLVVVDEQVLISR